MENTTSISPVPPVQIKVEPLSPSHYSNNEPEQPLNLAQSTSTPVATRENHTADQSMYQGMQNATGSHSMNGSPSLHMAYNSDATSYNKNGDLNINLPYSGISANSPYSIAQQNSANMYMTEKPAAANMIYGGYGYDLPGMTGEMMDSGFSDENFNIKNGGGPRSGSKRSNLPKRYKCAMCAYKTRYKSDLNRHVRKHAVATFNCEICNMPFKTVGNVEFHKRKEHADLLETPSVDTFKYKCTHCTYGTMYSSDLTRHVRKHYVAKFHCNACNKPFMTSGSLVHHKRSVHNMNDVEVVMGMGGVESVNQMDITTLREENAELEVNQNSSEQMNGNASRVEMESENKKSDDNVENGSETPKTTTENLNGKETGATNGDVNSENVGQAEKEMDAQSNDAEKETYTYEEPDRENEISITIDRSENDGVSKHTCPYCDKSFGRKMVLEYHLRNIHKMKNEGNASMFVEYPDDYELALDMSIQELENSTSDATPSNTPGVYTKPRHQCPFCAYATNYKSTYDRHVKKHDLECHICNVCRMPL